MALPLTLTQVNDTGTCNDTNTNTNYNSKTIDILTGLRKLYYYIALIIHEL